MWISTYDMARFGLLWLRSGKWGVLVVSLSHGDTLFDRNADLQFLPASTMKLLTTVSALETFEVPRPWLWGGLFFVAGWLLTEIGLLRRDANRDPEKIVTRLLPVISAASWLRLSPRRYPARTNETTLTISIAR